ncbi:MAG: 50S ribosomal protein L17 [Deltaproteobacteria bacterium]|nr:MAG: 50S ribosomal protein L17 [Deltaproteobacteria bacterium]
MRHRKSGRRLGRNSSHRKAMLRNLVTSFLENGSIRTTDTRAKEVRRLAEKLITLGKKALRSSFPADVSDEAYAQRRLHLHRQILKVVRKKSVAQSIMGELAERFEERPGGYTRILKLGFRRGDNAPVSILELLDQARDFGGDAEYSEEDAVEEAAE